MILIQVPRGVAPCQVEFPEGVKERSCAGSMHLKPGSTKLITSAELEHLLKSHPKLRLHVVAKDVQDRAAELAERAKKEAAAKAKAASEAAARDAASAASTKASKKAAKAAAQGGDAAK